MTTRTRSTIGNLVVSEEVGDAIEAGRPVLALESTIFTHGLPRPRNVAVALEAEDIVRNEGAIPATIAIVDGTPTVGLTPSQIENLSSGESVVKVSVRDIAVAAAKRLHGGTTVAATALLAARAGIRVFSTGGLGGVHRGAATSFDESADLTTLASVPLVVVSAGVKSILDIPLTLERMETLNLTVVGYRTSDYPGFYLADSGYDLEYRVDDVEEIADIVTARDALAITSSILIANPVPTDRQLPPDEHDRVLARAWSAAEKAGVIGHDTTPFLLEFIQRATDGRSLDVNVDVYRGNVALGARIAAALAPMSAAVRAG